VRPGFPYYARPRLGERTPLTADAVRAVRARQRELQLPESFEWVEQSAPDLAAAATAAGLHVHRHPMLTLGTLAPVPLVPPAVSVRIVGPDDHDLIQAWAVPGVAFAHPGGEIGRAGLTERDKLAAGHDPAVIDVVRERLRAGRSVLATAAGPDGPLAAGSYQYADGVAEITGVGVLPGSRRMGLGAAVTHALAAHALARGARIVFLSAADSDTARIYAGLGFREIGTAVIAEPPDALPAEASAADAVQLRRGETGQGPALAGEVRLIGVPGADRDAGQVGEHRGGVEDADEALEAQDSLERLGPVAGRGQRAAAELALAEVHLGGDLLGTRGRVAQHRHRLRDGGIGAAVRDQRPGDVEQPAGRLGRAQRRGKLPGRGLQDVGERYPPVAKLAQRQPEHLAAGGRPEPDADQHGSRAGPGADRPGVRAGHVGAGALLPDEVTAPVRQHQAGVAAVTGDHAGPQAGHRPAQRGGRRPLRVPGREPGARRHPVRGQRPHLSRMPLR
jgi:ribosomal protein S18 acetylase RimI-like enzyme